MPAHSMMHTLESMVFLVQTSLPSDAMGMSHSCSTADIPIRQLVEYLMLLEFAAKGKLLEVSDSNVAMLRSHNYYRVGIIEAVDSVCRDSTDK